MFVIWGTIHQSYVTCYVQLSSQFLLFAVLCRDVCRLMLATTITSTTLFSCWSQTHRKSIVSGIIGVGLDSKVRVPCSHVTVISTKPNCSSVRSRSSTCMSCSNGEQCTFQNISFCQAFFSMHVANCVHCVCLLFQLLFIV